MAFQLCTFVGAHWAPSEDCKDVEQFVFPTCIVANDVSSLAKGCSCLRVFSTHVPPWSVSGLDEAKQTPPKLFLQVSGRRK